MSYPPPPYGIPPVYPAFPTRRRARARASVLLPLIGVTLVTAGILVLPWGRDTWLYTIVKDYASATEQRTDVGYGVEYAVYLAYPSLLFGTLLAFAANLDSRAFRWLHFALGTLGLLVAVIVELVTAGALAVDAPKGDRSWIAVAVIGVVVLLFGFLVLLGFAFLRGLALRLVGGFLLIGYAATSALAAADLAGTGAITPYPTAFLPALGWLLCAIGAFSGPRYEHY